MDPRDFGFRCSSRSRKVGVAGDDKCENSVTFSCSGNDLLCVEWDVKHFSFTHASQGDTRRIKQVTEVKEGNGDDDDETDCLRFARHLDYQKKKRLN